MKIAQPAETTRSGRRPWLFRGLIIVAAGLFLVSWFAPWWGASVSDLLGNDHMLMRPWGVEAVDTVVAYVDRSLISMPAFFAPLMWVYLGLCVAALLTAILVEKWIELGRFRLSLQQVLIGIVGLSYLIVVVAAFSVAHVKAGNAGVQFVGSTVVFNPMQGGQTTVTGALKPGYWLAVAVGPVLMALALLRNFIVGEATE